MKPTAASLFSAPLLLFFMLLSQASFPDNTGAIDKARASKDDIIFKEKIYIHFDKSFYNSGENIWYKIYLVDAINHNPKTSSSIVYVDLIDPNNTIIDSKTIKINKGSGNGDFNLPAVLLKGTYTVRAYTNFMRNFDSTVFFRKTILIDSETHEESTSNPGKAMLKISFFPEGGQIVGGFVNNIGFKAINKDGKGVNISGSILDETDQTVRTFKASKFGHGMFQFIPEKGKHYKATVLYKGEQYAYELPTIKDYGVLMRVNEYNDFFRINMYSSLLNTKAKLKLIGLQKGDIVCQTELSGDKPEMAINVPKSDLKPGLIEFRLLDENDIILGKALAFSDSANFKNKPSISISKSVYGKNEAVEVDISLSEIMQKNTVANMSITVTEASPLNRRHYASDIKSHLFLTSELLEDIEQPGYYIYSKDAQRKNDLALLLRSQDINQNVFKANPSSNTLQFSSESGFNLKGIIKEKHNNKPAKAKVVISYKNNKDLGYDQAITDSLGRFNFSNLNFDERTFVSIKAKRLSSQKYGGDFTIEIDTVLPPIVNAKRVSEKNTKTSTTFLESNVKQYRNIEFVPRKGEIKLEKVELTATKKRLDRYTKKRKLSLYISPSHTLDVKNSNIIAHNPLEALQGKFPGFDVIGRKIIIRGKVFDMVSTTDPFGIGTAAEEKKKRENKGEAPLFLVDGFPSDYDFVVSMSIQDIDFIDIIKGPRTAIYGSRGGNGVIAVYTLDGSEENDEQNNRKRGLSFYHPGYYLSRKFYQDKDNPTTLYWNPDLKLEGSNNAKIAFNTANKSATYKVLLEGITSNGTPFRAEAYFDVN